MSRPREIRPNVYYVDTEDDAKKGEPGSGVSIVRMIGFSDRYSVFYKGTEMDGLEYKIDIDTDGSTPESRYKSMAIRTTLRHAHYLLIDLGCINGKALRLSPDKRKAYLDTYVEAINILLVGDYNSIFVFCSAYIEEPVNAPIVVQSFVRSVMERIRTLSAVSDIDTVAIGFQPGWFTKEAMIHFCQIETRVNVMINFVQEEDLYKEVENPSFTGETVLSYFAFNWTQVKLREVFTFPFRMVDVPRFYRSYLEQMRLAGHNLPEQFAEYFALKGARHPSQHHGPFTGATGPDPHLPNPQSFPVFRRYPVLHQLYIPGSILEMQMRRMEEATTGIQVVLALLLPQRSVRHQGVGCMVRYLPLDVLRRLPGFLYASLEDEAERNVVKQDLVNPWNG
jgi:hypothetical protein